MDVRKTVAYNLRRLRVERGFSQDSFALEAEIDRTYVSLLEQGKQNPSLVILDHIARALGVRHEELFKDPPSGAKQLPPLRKGRKPKPRSRRKATS
ncbi:MAG: helix-turn-helix transcriptional regulator [Alphaproteobacteria bacterium]